MDNQYDAETQIMVLEIDFRWGGLFNTKNVAEDIILLPRPKI